MSAGHQEDWDDEQSLVSPAIAAEGGERDERVQQTLEPQTQTRRLITEPPDPSDVRDAKRVKTSPDEGRGAMFPNLEGVSSDARPAPAAQVAISAGMAASALPPTSSSPRGTAPAAGEEKTSTSVLVGAEEDGEDRNGTGKLGLIVPLEAATTLSLGNRQTGETPIPVTANPPSVATIVTKGSDSAAPRTLGEDVEVGDAPGGRRPPAVSAPISPSAEVAAPGTAARTPTGGRLAPFYPLLMACGRKIAAGKSKTGLWAAAAAAAAAAATVGKVTNVIFGRVTGQVVGNAVDGATRAATPPAMVGAAPATTIAAAEREVSSTGNDGLLTGGVAFSNATHVATAAAAAAAAAAAPAAAAAAAAAATTAVQHEGDTVGDDGSAGSGKGKAGGGSMGAPTAMAKDLALRRSLRERAILRERREKALRVFRKDARLYPSDAENAAANRRTRRGWFAHDAWEMRRQRRREGVGTCSWQRFQERGRQQDRLSHRCQQYAIASDNSKMTRTIKKNAFRVKTWHRCALVKEKIASDAHRDAFNAEDLPTQAVERGLSEATLKAAALAMEEMDRTGEKLRRIQQLIVQRCGVCRQPPPAV